MGPAADAVRSTLAGFAAPFELRIATPADRPALQRMLELYQHDLSDLWDQDIDEHGEYGYALDLYGQRPGCRAYVVCVAGRYAGFALVTPDVILPGGDHWMAQFFIMKKYRRRGIGEAVATRLFDAWPGRWQVGQMPLNRPAVAFWRGTIGRYTGGRYTETEVTQGWWLGTLQQFESPGRP